MLHFILIHVQIAEADLLFSLIRTFCWLTLIRHFVFSRYDLALCMVAVVVFLFICTFLFGRLK